MRFPCPSLRCAAIAACCFWVAGCRSLGKQSPSQEALATGRQLSQQGIAALETGRIQEGEKLLRQATEAVPSDPESHRYLAEALWQQGSSPAAIRHVEMAHALAPTDPAIAVRAGEMLLAVGNKPRAMERAEKAISIDPKLPEAWALRGRISWQMRELDNALADLQRALQFSPSSPDLLIDVANLYYQRGEPQRCLTTVHRLMDTHPLGEEPIEAIVLEGKAYLTMGLPIPASERFALAKSRAAPDPDLCCLLAQAEFAAGRSEAALVAVREAVSLDAAHVQSRELLARLTGTPQDPTLR